MGVRLEDLTPGALAGGITGDGAVTVVAVRWIGSNAVQVTFRAESGRLDERLLYRDHEPRLTLRQAAAAYDFSADGRLFKLAAEALRIRMAARFDPMLAVHTSDLEPLPHQIEAVYGELLERTPLRFLLADDPGAGKTIMAGLYAKELMLRGDAERILIVAPGSLVDQWQEELADKFGLQFEQLTRQLADSVMDGSAFTRFPLLIARMDQLSRSDELRKQLDQCDWDLVVVDEAHRMAAHYFGSELHTTKRYQLGQLLGRRTRHLLLMTATPHSGKEEDFQLFMALLDSDRFEGRYRDAVHAVDTEGMMRRMVKEELLTFEGRPLFPERRAYTVPYPLSKDEQDLYDAVTQYVREEMNRADRLRAEGDRRGVTVGFALTVLQRRLASSPEAILKSLERRRHRLERRRREMTTAGRDSELEQSLRSRLAELLGRDVPDDLDELDDLAGGEKEELESEVADAATAAQTAAELEHEISLLADLEELARRVRHSGTDRKWTELRDLLSENALIRDGAGNLHKIIIFTEHRDTLEYLTERIRSHLGQPEAVVVVHGGVRREERRKVMEVFSQDPEVRVLVATDAAGEGLNLQRAHLMVNYDLPWNPNRIEQRFGRIHRIGQTEVCHLWNLVADGTREGMVFARLLGKLEQQRETYKGKVFDVLGQAFDGQPLRELLMEAIRYGERPEIRARLDQIIDATVGEGLDKLIAERAADHDILARADLEHWRAAMDEARARRLQPHYVRAFFLAAFKLLGGSISEREAGRYEVRHVPADIRDRDRQIGIGAPVLRRYERVTFDRELTGPPGRPRTELLAPGHPLLDAVTDLVIERYGSLLKHGTMLVNRHDPAEEPRLLAAVTQEITDGHNPARTVAKRFEFVEIGHDGARPTAEARYLDYEPIEDFERTAAQHLVAEPWLSAGVDELAVDWSVEHGLPALLASTREHLSTRVGQTRKLVRQRLTQEINYWDARHAELLEAEAAGRQLKIKPDTAFRRARDLEGRLERRLADLARDEDLTAKPPAVTAGALVMPQGLLDKLLGRSESGRPRTARNTPLTDRRAIAAVVAAELQLGRKPREMPHNNPGYDIQSQAEDGHLVFIEVKGRIAGADDFWVTKTEALTGKNSAIGFRLVLVSVHPNGPEQDEVRYIVDPFRDVDFGDFNATGLGGNWDKEWARGGEPI
ncbi:MAG TPA: helicase-related protein [Streptosporangiaceae bacterium]|nr:helicase-related protein [Streptosporangiaceae bacterium]